MQTTTRTNCVRMLNNIKQELLKSPETIATILEHYGYVNIKIRPTYMSFGRDIYSSPKSIVIQLENNDYLYVTDYARNLNCDFFSFIVKQRNVEFRDVLEITKQYLGITDYYLNFQKKEPFGGFYSRIKCRNSEKTPPKIYDRSVLNKYPQVYNTRFLKDHISLYSQKFFDIRYDIENDGIVIPILDQTGQLMGIKERVNHEIEEDEQKYWYALPCRASKTLYAYSNNYQFLTDSTVLVFESEKSCMQCHSYGIRNCVALGSGSISKDQIKMIYELNPKKVLFLHDYGYDKEAILKNVNAFDSYLRFSDTKVGYWDWTQREGLDKVSPSDLGKAELKKIIRNEIVLV